MKHQRFPMQRFAFSVLAIGLAAAALHGHASRRHKKPMIQDWSTRHLIFSKPKTAECAALIQKDLRYALQSLRRNSPAAVATNTDLPDATVLGSFHFKRPGGRGARTPSFHRDWSTSLGAGASMQPGAFPAKFTFDTDSASCSDYVAFTTNLPALAAPSIIAFNNLYAGTLPVGACTGPSVLFAYETQTNGGVTATSPVLSFFDSGAQIAYIEGGGGVGVLHVLRWRPDEGGTVDAPVTVGNASTAGADYVTCKATAQSCLLSLTFTNGSEDTGSAPFVDYDHDNLYVGDDSGFLHKFTGVFKGTPAEVIIGGWPVTVNEAAGLTSPVYDSVSNNIYVGDSFGVLSFVKDTPASGVGGCASGAAPCLGDNAVATGSSDGWITDAPIVDSTNATVFAFVGAAHTPTDTSTVFQAPTTLATSTEATIGAGAFNFTTFQFNPVYSGAFDNNYFTAPESGFLYVCGNQVSLDGTTQNAAIYRIGFDASGLMNNANDGNILAVSAPLDIFSPATTACSPVTEIFDPNTNTDLMFLSVQNNSNLANCSGSATVPGSGCVISIDVTSGFPATVSHSVLEAGGTSGIIIDNTASDVLVPQAASLYFTRLAQSACPSGTTGCAVKLTQAGFQ